MHRRTLLVLVGLTAACKDPPTPEERVVSELHRFEKRAFDCLVKGIVKRTDQTHCVEAVRVDFEAWRRDAEERSSTAVVLTIRETGRNLDAEARQASIGVRDLDAEQAAATEELEQAAFQLQRATTDVERETAERRLAAARDRQTEIDIDRGFKAYILELAHPGQGDPLEAPE